MGYGNYDTSLDPRYFLESEDSEEVANLAKIYLEKIQTELPEWAARHGVEDYFLDVVDPTELTYQDFIVRLEHYQDDYVTYGSGVFLNPETKTQQINPNPKAKVTTQDAEISLYSQDFPGFSLEIFRDLNNTDPNDPLIQYSMAMRPAQKRLSEFVQTYTPEFVDEWIEVDSQPNFRFAVPNFALQYPDEPGQALHELREYFYARIENPVQKIRFQFEIEAMIKRACELQGCSYVAPTETESLTYEFVITAETLLSGAPLLAYDLATGHVYQLQFKGAIFDELRRVAAQTRQTELVIKINRLEFLQNQSFDSVGEIKILPDGSRHLPQTTYAQESQNGEIRIQEVFDWQKDDADFAARVFDMAQQGLLTAAYSLGGAAASRGSASRAFVANTEVSLPANDIIVYQNWRTATSPFNPNLQPVVNGPGLGNTRVPALLWRGGADRITFNTPPTMQSSGVNRETLGGWFPNTNPQSYQAQDSSGLASGKSMGSGGVVAITNDVPAIPSAAEIFKNHITAPYHFWVKNMVIQNPTNSMPATWQVRAWPKSLPMNSPQAGEDVLILPTIAHLPQTLPMNSNDTNIKIADPKQGLPQALPSGEPREVWIWDGNDFTPQPILLSQIDPNVDPELAELEGAFVRVVDRAIQTMNSYLQNQITAEDLRFQLSLLKIDFDEVYDKFIKLRAQITSSEIVDPYSKAWLHDFSQPLSVIVGNWQLIEITQRITPEFIKTKIDVFSRKAAVSNDTLIYTSMLNSAEAALRESDLYYQRPIKISLPPTSKQVRLRIPEQNVALERILNNWCTNAARYQNPDIAEPYIRVETYKLPNGQVVLEVDDNGVGFLNTSVSRIGVMGLQEGRLEIAQSTGTGLFSVVELAKKQGWGLSISTQEGKGTTWRLTLPIQDIRDQGEQLPTRNLDEDGFHVIVPAR